ncbi:MAG: glutaminyl-peptide cyclotransferase [Verrucomicrobia bacterium]|nr:glutaminyl-peptide cyclotransferase [Verrucomicrobiota bacterium]MDA1068125.1 glutaminyl-peptide cyclotransferase [Verrucomicrobiota bacterium]
MIQESKSVLRSSIAYVRSANGNSCWIGLLITLAFGLSLSGCAKHSDSGEASIPPSLPETVSYYTYEVINAWPHDPEAFTQGLLFHQGSLLESTGLNGKSSLREVDWQTGRVKKQVSVPDRYFAEGLTVIDGKAYQLTWRNQKGFIYDADTFQVLGEFSYQGEGWGLTTDGNVLILSDGTNQIRFLDPTTFSVVRTIKVQHDGKAVDNLNELEFIHGEIFANIWQTNRIVRIDPSTGSVRGVIDLRGLLAVWHRRPNTDVLNGIAYDRKSDRLFVTGKNWPKLFEVRLKRIP